MQRLAEGTKLNNKYKIVRFLGQGGFAITYEAVNEQINLRVCVKELFVTGVMERDSSVTQNVSMIGDEERCKRSFVHEAQVLGQIQNPLVVKVLDYFEENQTAYMVLEYLDGVNLKQFVAQNGPISSDQLFMAVKPLLKVLDECHTEHHLLHRDIAPDNIMVSCAADGESLELKLFDFGSARATELPEYTCILKDGYSPIEQVASGEKQGAFTDIYALCATMMYCLTGEKPEGAYSRLLDDGLVKPSKRGIAIDPRLESVLMKGLEIQPQDRYASAKDMLEDIEKVLPSKKILNDQGAGDEESGGKGLRKNKKGWVLAGIVLVLVLIGGLAVFSKSGQSLLKNDSNSANLSEMTYDPEKMYKVTLTPGEDFTVSGYNQAIENLKGRLEVFSEKSGSYSLSEDDGVITLLLNKEDFAENKADNSKYGTTEYDYAAIPEFVLRAYLSRAYSLALQQEGTDEMIALDQTKDMETSLKDGRFEVLFTDDFKEENAETLKKWQNQYELVKDVDSKPACDPYETVPMEDGNGFYLDVDDTDAVYNDLLQYNLTHEPLEHDFNIAIEEQTAWQEDEKDFGKYQKKESDLENISCRAYVYGCLTEGELMDCQYVLKKRLDALESPYALGEMDSLTGVTAGVMAPVYDFIGIELTGDKLTTEDVTGEKGSADENVSAGEDESADEKVLAGEDESVDEKVARADILDMVLCSTKFYLCADDGTQAELYASTLVTDQDGIRVKSSAFADSVSEKAKEFYLAYETGNQTDLVKLMETDRQTNGEMVFSSFVGGEKVNSENNWICEVIEKCVENQLPKALSTYDLQ